MSPVRSVTPHTPAMYSLIGRWTIKPGSEGAARTALRKLAKDVQKNEPHTLLYLVFTPDMRQQSFPGASPQEVIFVEGYKSKQHFLEHINGPVFKAFMAKHAGLFAAFDGDSHPFMEVEYLAREGGFMRPEGG